MCMTAGDWDYPINNRLALPGSPAPSKQRMTGQKRKLGNDAGVSLKGVKNKQLTFPFIVQSFNNYDF